MNDIFVGIPLFKGGKDDGKSYVTQQPSYNYSGVSNQASPTVNTSNNPASSGNSEQQAWNWQDEWWWSHQDQCYYDSNGDWSFISRVEEEWTKPH